MRTYILVYENWETRTVHCNGPDDIFFELQKNPRLLEREKEYGPIKVILTFSALYDSRVRMQRIGRSQEVK